MKEERMTVLMITPGGGGVKTLSFKVLHIKVAFFTLIGFTLLSLLSFMSSYIFL